jgi:hypothetical protein
VADERSRDAEAASNHLSNEVESAAMTVPEDLRCYGMKQVYFNGPDGYVICFQQPTGE